MLTQPQVQRYSAQSGLRDIMIAEKEIILTYVLQLLSERASWGSCRGRQEIQASALRDPRLNEALWTPTSPDREYRRRS